ncbi:MAG TPA: serine/threonine-protein kinase [Ilumatobacteraceae bacterium]|nr:serine/threonine-protein kinase [Ilumatobacteraceae bacterium]
MSDTSAWQSPLSPGEPRSFGGGRYVVQRRLGAGNFATVYLAHDERLAVPVAVKLLSDRWSWEPEVRGRFVQEARLLRSLNDARVVQIRDIAETEDGRPYLVMDFATEGTLEQRMVELAQKQVRLGPDQLRVAAHAIADALGVLHERRIAHRDVKPSNMLITRAAGTTTTGQRAASTDNSILRPGERLMLGDLGLAKDLAFDSGVTVGVGTAGYMAPEQSLAGAKIDTRTDIFAASALLAQIACGEAPDPVRRVSSGTIEHGRPLPDTIPLALRQALLRGLDTNPDRRQQTIEQWLAEVDGALASLTDVPPTTVAANRRRRPVAIAAITLVGLTGVGLAVYSAIDSSTPSSSLDTNATGLRVELSGPRKVKMGKQAIWNVDAPGAISGVWTLNGPVQPDPDTWKPGNWFSGTWNVQGSITLTLTVVDSKGNKASDSITFVVE